MIVEDVNCVDSIDDILTMPTICEFFSIVIRMYYDDHTPPHFHAYYGEYDASININTLEIVNGSLPGRAISLVLEWAQDHRKELMRNWQLASEHKPLNRIEPLA